MIRLAAAAIHVAAAAVMFWAARDIAATYSRIAALNGE